MKTNKKIKTKINFSDTLSKTKDGDIELERLIEMFEDIIDIRESSGKRHCLTHIIEMSVCGILNKCTDLLHYLYHKQACFSPKVVRFSS